MEEIVRDSLARGVHLCCVLAFASRAAAPTRLWNTRFGGSEGGGIHTFAAPAIFSRERFRHSACNGAGESTGSSKHFYNTFMWFLGRRGLFSLPDLLRPVAFHLTLLMSTRCCSCELSSIPGLRLENLHRCLHPPPHHSSTCPRGLEAGGQGSGSHWGGGRKHSWRRQRWKPGLGKGNMEAKIWGAKRRALGKEKGRRSK